jgi:hypothetical protein
MNYIFNHASLPSVVLPTLPEVFFATLESTGVAVGFWDSRRFLVPPRFARPDPLTEACVGVDKVRTFLAAIRPRRRGDWPCQVGVEIPTFQSSHCVGGWVVPGSMIDIPSRESGACVGARWVIGCLQKGKRVECGRAVDSPATPELRHGS